MTRRRGELVSAVAALTLLVSLAVGCSRGDEPFETHRCVLVAFRELATCGTMRVAESPRWSSRTIRIRFAVLPARVHRDHDDPIVYLTGGPGLAATEAGHSLDVLLGQARDHRDVILVDQRGTGGSNALRCDLYDTGRLQPLLDPMFPVDRVKQCAARLSPHADLAAYTTTNSAQDLSEVLGALRVPVVNLVGVSYGTRLALEYARKFPKNVRRMVLQGVGPPELPLLSAGAFAGERALAAAASACHARASCRDSIPDAMADVDTLMARLRRAPMVVPTWNWRLMRREPLQLTARGAAERLFSMLYSPGGARRALGVVHHAVQGDPRPMVDLMLADSHGRKRARAEGLMLSVLCGEDAERLTAADTSAESREVRLGLPIVRELVAACAVWPPSDRPVYFTNEVRSKVRTLLLSGGLDPISPPEWGNEAARWLPNSVHLIDAGNGHGAATQCVGSRVALFIALREDEPMESGCLKVATPAM